HCCLPGGRVDGHRFAGEAVAAGATSLLVRRDIDLPVTRVVVDDPRAAMAPVSAGLHGHPSRTLTVIGVTGTNGKTTTTHLLAHVLSAAGRPCSTLGTLTGGFTTPTTPEAPFLQEALATARDRGDTALALEVSSHALVRHRVDATTFAVAVFTGLSQDHLDEHGTMEGYFAAKARLFTEHEVGHAVIVVDDPWGARLAREVEGAGRIEVTRVALADWDPTWSLSLPGDHNRRNALCALAVARVLGISAQVAVDALTDAPEVPGRMERVDAGQPFTAYVDYAHKPGALDAVLHAARPAQGRVLVVFGCGGDRDRTKRAEMGRLAASLADVAILTTDNPRREEPLAIIDDVLAGIDGSGGAEVHVEVDRRRAIELGVRLAQAGDVLLVAGKGHETEQEVGGRRLPFDDRIELRRALLGPSGPEERGSLGPSGPAERDKLGTT
ncbi:MAG TPA: UDP-N-acetylmuramoyl-L-alanyl-D-glutamate--2,6-diaminopimelate ligase, partial [Acidimicrobiales bacterium]|nr:UDP-N-acetylmuramoyl-L-alanyl-D-glutamate--2,6-diaminopimelate ligase [Acidimicrobiales bacterium]